VGACPDPGEELLLREDAMAILEQEEQEPQDFRFERDSPVAAPQLEELGVGRELREY
jgi:hypothetical protein